MATVVTTPTTVTIALTAAEKLAALRGDVVLRRDDVESARIADQPFDAVRGVRAPGVGWPRRIALGTWRHRGGKDLVMLRRGDRAVVLELGAEAPFRRAVVGVASPEGVVAALG